MDFSELEAQKKFKIVDEIHDILISNGRTMAQGALAYIWPLDERMVPIPGFKSVRQVQENAGALELGPLTAAEVQEIRTIVAKYELRG